MSLKNSLNKYFSLPYYQLLLKRHKSLFIVPLVIYFCVLFLTLLLGGDIEFIFLYIIPASTLFVPVCALTLFRPYTKKGDVAYLTSIPLTREQLFMTTYCVGLTIIETVLFMMVFIGLINNSYDLVISLITFLCLGVIYFSLACLGCMLSGHTLKQMINMGVICFGPVGLYLLSKWSMADLTFGHYTSPIDRSLVMLICPLASAAKFLDDRIWPYFMVHIFLVIGCIYLCFYLLKHRPLERTEQNVLFEKINNWVIRPIVYLNLVYFVFNLCASAILSEQHYYNQSYYMSVLLLFVGVSLLVGVLMSIWKSKSIKEILQLKDQVILSFIAVSLLVFPLWQSENGRTKYLSENVEVFVDVPLDMKGTWIEMDKEVVLSFLESASKDRHLFLNDYSQAGIYIGNDQCYYFNIEDMKEPTRKFLETIYLQAREVDYFWDYYEDYTLIDHQVISVDSLKKAIISTYETTLRSDFIQEDIDELYDNEWDSYIAPYYVYTFSSLDYNAWQDVIISNSKVILDQAEWKKIENVVQDIIFHPFNYTILSSNIKSIVQSIDVMSLDYKESWSVEYASDNQVRLVVGVDAYILEDCTYRDLVLFEDTEYWLQFVVEVNLVDGQWIPSFTGVYY